MNRTRTLATALLLGLSTAAFAMPASAAPCRDAHGRFTACTGAAATKAKPARTAARTAAKPVKVAARTTTAAKPVKVASRTTPTRTAKTAPAAAKAAPAHRTAG